jgi:hypothetical protein
MTRWFWFGGAITPEEITRELTFMREAGIGGVELQPLYPLEADDPTRAIRNTRFFSAEWLSLLQHTVDEAKRLDLQLDLTLGSSWPSGGPFIPMSSAARRLRVLTHNAGGPGEFSWDVPTYTLWDERIVAALAAPILPTGQPDISRVKVITDQFKPRMKHGGALGYEIQGWEVPAGLWEIMVFANSPLHELVRRPSLGMEGYVVDHLSQESVQLFLDAAGTRIFNQLRSPGAPPFRSIFCNSEAPSTDWTWNFMEEFERRRGYDLTPFLPALAVHAGPLTPHIRYDFHLTLDDLILDNFFGALARFAEMHGMTARLQGRGHLGDSMHAYGLAHIPDGETSEEFADSYSVDIHYRRLASSAGHVYGKPIISDATYIFLTNRYFSESLELLKRATDAVFLDGMNHIVNHGYPSSPPQAGKPGWRFYASTFINHNQTWWRHYPHLTGYIQRVQSLLVQGVSVNPVAVYLPLADVYVKLPRGEAVIEYELEDAIGADWLLELRRKGYDFDFVNDDVLASRSSVRDAKLHAGTGVYSAVIVAGVRFMPLESLERLVEFARGGGFLVFAERLPESAPGLRDQEQRTSRLRALLKDLWGGTEPNMGGVERVGRGKVAWAPDTSAALTRLEEELNPDFRILEAGDGSETHRRLARENVGFLHRRSGPLDFYFISNISEHLQDLRIQFAVGHRTPERWNPEAGGVEETVVFDYAELAGGKGQATEVQLRLEPYESCFVVFTSSASEPLVTRTNWLGPLRLERTGNRIQATGLLPANGDYYLTRPAPARTRHFKVRTIPEPVPLRGGWELQLEDTARIHLTELRSWTDIDEARTYSGWGSYETTFEIRDLGVDVEWLLDLGRIHETAEAVLNGTPLGAAWKGWRRLPCGKALKVGANQLRVEVANLWVNKVLSTPPRDLRPLAETFGLRWGGDGGHWASIKTGTSPQGEPLPSGLLGPVRLIPLKRWTEVL